MATELAARFLSSWPGPFSPQGRLVYTIPEQQNTLIALGQQQIEAQRAAAKAISRSNIAAAAIVAAEINQQTEILERRMQVCAEQMSSAVYSAADQISGVIENLGDRLCAYLGEIRWELAQQKETLSGILQVLREGRSNEARQLVEQGVRHYANQQYERAEERFRLALAQNSTDYQVLMNLGLVAVHRGAAAEAAAHFHDALRLPATLDLPSQVRALMALARVHYAQRDYRSAHLLGRRAIGKAGSGEVADLFTVATYSALAGFQDESIANLEEAITRDAAFFTRSLVEPDLDGQRDAVLNLLSRLAERQRGKVLAAVEDTRRLAKRPPEITNAKVNELLSRAAIILRSVEEASTQIAYHDLFVLERTARSIETAVATVLRVQEMEREKASAAQQVPPLVEKLEKADRHCETLEQIPPFEIRLWFLWHVMSVFAVAALLDGFGLKIGPAIAGIYFWLGMPLWIVVVGILDERSKRIRSEQDAERGKRKAAVVQATKAVAEVEARILRLDGDMRALLLKVEQALDAGYHSVRSYL